MAELTYIPYILAPDAPEGDITHVKERYWVFHVKLGFVFVDDVPQYHHSEEKAEAMLAKFDRNFYKIEFAPSVFYKKKVVEAPKVTKLPAKKK